MQLRCQEQSEHYEFFEKLLGTGSPSALPTSPEGEHSVFFENRILIEFVEAIHMKKAINYGQARGMSLASGLSQLNFQKTRNAPS
jgi:hypothetical protein